MESKNYETVIIMTQKAVINFKQYFLHLCHNFDLCFNYALQKHVFFSYAMEKMCEEKKSKLN